MGKQDTDLVKRRYTLDVDKVLNEVGHFGWYQLRLFIMVLPPILFCSMNNSQYVFNAGDLKYRCFVPECEKRPGKMTPGDWAEWALTPDSSCERQKPINGKQNCERTSFSKKSTEKCHAWVYESNATIVAEFDLACSEWKRTFVGTIHSIGVFTSMAFIGIVSDSIGRKTTFIASVVFGAGIGLSRSFVNSYIFYITLEYIEPLLGAGVYSTGFVLVTEMVGKEKRVLCGSIMASVYALGQVQLAVLAWNVPYWRHLTRIIYTPSLLVVFYFLCLPESIRWLVNQEKSSKALHVLKKVATSNGKRLSEVTIKSITDFMKETERLEIEAGGHGPSVCRQVLGSKILVTRVIICSSTWITVSLVYYGLSINSVSLMGNKYINYMLTSVVEIPGYILSNLVLDRFGRKTSISGALLTCGIVLFTMPLIPMYYQLIPNLFAKCFISMAFVSIYIFTMELFPTNCRHSLMGICSLIGRIGSITAPLTPMLLKINYWLPYVVFAIVSCVAALLLLLAPETLRKPLPDTIAQAEQIGSTPQLPRGQESIETNANEDVATRSNPDEPSTSKANKQVNS